MSAIGREELDISHRAETGMFGNKRDPAKLPRSEPLILLALDVVMAVALTLGYYACWLWPSWGARARSGGTGLKQQHMALSGVRPHDIVVGASTQMA